MSEEVKAHDVPKDDPEYKAKVSEIVQKRFEQERLKSIEREQAKMAAGRNKEKPQVSPAVPTDNKLNSIDKNLPQQQQPVEIKDPEEYVRRKDIVALVNQLNKSFAIIEQHRIKTEKIFTKIKEAFNLDE